MPETSMTLWEEAQSYSTSFPVLHMLLMNRAVNVEEKPQSIITRAFSIKY